MAREVHVKQGETVSRFTLSKVSREKLYGKKTRRVIDEQGNPCSSRSLSIDGSVLVASGGYAQMYLTPDGDVLSSREITKTDSEGTPIPATESTLNVPQGLTETNPDCVLDHLVSSAYLLEAQELEPELQEALEAGKIFKTVFAYRRGSALSPAFLMKNEQDYFLLVSTPHNFEFCAPDQQMVEQDTDSDPFTDDLDFGMM